MFLILNVILWNWNSNNGTNEDFNKAPELV